MADVLHNGTLTAEACQPMRAKRLKRSISGCRGVDTWDMFKCPKCTHVCPRV